MCKLLFCFVAANVLYLANLLFILQNFIKLSWCHPGASLSQGPIVGAYGASLSQGPIVGAYGASLSQGPIVGAYGASLSQGPIVGAGKSRFTLATNRPNVILN
jgi:hypothetical protein